MSFLTSLRQIREYQDNVFDPLRPLQGASITVANYYKETPSEPHLWSRQTAFELQAIVG